MGNYRFLDLSAVFRLIVIVWIFAADFLSDVVPNRRNFDPAIVNLRLRRFGSVPIFFVIVMWIFTPEFINAVVPNRRNFDATIINLRLRRFGPVAVRFTHRDSFRLTGTLQLSSLSSRNYHFYSGEFSRTVSVDEYFFIKYGITLQRPDDHLIFFMGSDDNRGCTNEPPCSLRK